MWLRTDLVRFDFYIWCVGCGKADVLLRPVGLGAPPPPWWVGGGRSGQLSRALLPFQHVESGSADSGHSSSATELHTDVAVSHLWL